MTEVEHWNVRIPRILAKSLEQKYPSYTPSQIILAIIHECIGIKEVCKCDKK